MLFACKFDNMYEQLEHNYSMLPNYQSTRREFYFFNLQNLSKMKMNTGTTELPCVVAFLKRPGGLKSSVSLLNLLLESSKANKVNSITSS